MKIWFNVMVILNVLWFPQQSQAESEDWLRQYYLQIADCNMNSPELTKIQIFARLNVEESDISQGMMYLAFEEDRASVFPLNLILNADGTSVKVEGLFGVAATIPQGETDVEFKLEPDTVTGRCDAHW